MNPNEQMVSFSTYQSSRDEKICRGMRNDSSRNYRRLVKKAQKKESS